MSVDNEVADGRGRDGRGRGADEQQSALQTGRMEEEDALSCWKEGEEVEEEGGQGEGGVEEAREKKEEDACIRHFLKMHGPTVASWQDAKDFWHQAKNAAESEAHDLAAREAAIRCLTYVLHMSYTCLTYVLHMSYTYPHICLNIYIFTQTCIETYIQCMCLSACSYLLLNECTYVHTCVSVHTYVANMGVH